MSRHGWLVVLILGVLLAPIYAQSCYGGSWVKKEGVLLGDPDNCTKPGKLEFKKVWNSIPEVVQIKKERPGPAQREILLAKAKKKLKKALRDEAYANGYDCIVAESAITGTPPAEPVDITQAIIDRIQGM